MDAFTRSQTQAKYLLSISLLSFSLTACLGGGSGGKGAIAGAGPSGTNDIELHFIEDAPTNGQPAASCDPLGSIGTPSSQNGLQGELWYFDFYRDPVTGAASGLPGGILGFTVDNYFGRAARAEDNATKVSGLDLFFKQIYVPNRSYTEPFKTTDGRELQKDDGSIVYEYFGIKLKSRLKLKDSDGVTGYQIGILSDDGSRVTIDTNGDGIEEEVARNDGTHSMRLRCSSLASPIQMARDSRLPVTIEYYQGQRQYLGVVMLWREINGSTVDDSECSYVNVAGDNNRYFDVNQSGSPSTAVYDGLIARGWKVIAPENFLLPSGSSSNPCIDTNGKVFPVPGRSCYTETWQNTNQTTFRLEHEIADSTLMYVTLNGNQLSSGDYQFVRNGNRVELLRNAVPSKSTVKVEYCTELDSCGPRGCDGVGI